MPRALRTSLILLVPDELLSPFLQTSETEGGYVTCPTSCSWLGPQARLEPRPGRWHVHHYRSMQWPPSWPCSQLPPAPLEDTQPARPTTQAARLQLAGLKLQTSHKWISEQGLFFFFFPWREADKAVPLGSCCLGPLKTLVGGWGAWTHSGGWWVLAPA